MPTYQIPYYGKVHIPGWVVDFDSFRRWIYEAELPEKLKIHFIGGHIWTDYYLEEMLAHSQVKVALGVTLGGLIAAEQLGVYVPSGVTLTNTTADLRTKPEAMFLSNRTIESGRIVVMSEERPDGGVAEVVGTPDLLVEIFSPTSGDNDMDRLAAQYWTAGIREYWLVDARKIPTHLHVYKRGPKDYTDSRHTDGWVKSAVLKRSFRLTRAKGAHGLTVYQLEYR